MTATEPRRLPDADFLTWMASYAEEHQPTGYPCVQTWEITRLVEMHRRLRISQLRRMASACGGIEDRMLTKASRQGLSLAYYRRCVWVRERGNRFRRACRAEIERLRGEG